MLAKCCSGAGRCSRTSRRRAPAAKGQARRPRRRRSPPPALSAELLLEALADNARVGLAAGFLHHLADEEAEQAFLAAAVGLDVAGVRCDDPVDERVQLGGVREGLLSQVRRGAKAFVAR